MNSCCLNNKLIVANTLMEQLRIVNTCYEIAITLEEGGTSYAAEIYAKRLLNMFDVHNSC